MTTNPAISAAPRAQAPSDEELIRRIRAGDTAVFEALMRRYNQRLYRVARAIVKDDAEAEDVMQQAYLDAYTHLHQFEHRGSFAAWLTRITVREALAGQRRRAAVAISEPIGVGPHDRIASPAPDPEQAAVAAELRRDLESIIGSLADAYRPVFVLREVEELTTSETAEALGLSEDVVKTRLLRARAMLREALARDGRRPRDLFPFGLERCDRVVAGVLANLAGRRADQDTNAAADSGAKRSSSYSAPA